MAGMKTVTLAIPAEVADAVRRAIAAETAGLLADSADLAPGDDGFRLWNNFDAVHKQFLAATPGGPVDIVAPPGPILAVFVHLLREYAERGAALAVVESLIDAQVEGWTAV